MHSLLYIFKILVCVDEMSDQKHVKCGVPQGSVCGPLPFRFSICFPWAEIIRKHGNSFHCYEYNTALYFQT